MSTEWDLALDLGIKCMVYVDREDHVVVDVRVVVCVG